MPTERTTVTCKYKQASISPTGDNSITSPDVEWGRRRARHNFVEAIAHLLERADSRRRILTRNIWRQFSRNPIRDIVLQQYTYPYTTISAIVVQIASIFVLPLSKLDVNLRSTQTTTKPGYLIWKQITFKEQYCYFLTIKAGKVISGPCSGLWVYIPSRAPFFNMCSITSACIFRFFLQKW